MAVGKNLTQLIEWNHFYHGQCLYKEWINANVAKLPDLQKFYSGMAFMFVFPVTRVINQQECSNKRLLANVLIIRYSVLITYSIIICNIYFLLENKKQMKRGWDNFISPTALKRTTGVNIGSLYFADKTTLC